MLYKIATQINWVDIVVAVVLFRVIYVAVNTGLFIEIFKILGTLTAIFLSLHYYSALGAFLQGLAGIKSIPVGFYQSVSFLALAAGGNMIFIFLRKIASKLWKLDTVTSLNKWGGVVLGITRSILLAGLLIFILVVPGDNYLNTVVSDSYLGRMAVKVAPATYSVLWNGVFSNFGTGKFNTNITEIKKSLRR